MVNGFVLDCSVTAAWFFEDEFHPEIDRIQDRVRDESALVPVLWFFEVMNALRQAEKRKRITLVGVRRY